MIKYIFDENMSPKLADALKALRGEDIDSIKNLGLLGKSDEELFSEFKKYSANSKCVFISGDKAIRKNKPELESLRDSNLIAFFCPPSFSSKKKAWEKVVYIVNAWDAIVELAKESKPKDLYNLPAQSVTKRSILTASSKKKK